MDHKIPASVIIMTKNEALNISKCLNVCQYFQEVIVVDSNSTDGTRDIAESYGVKVINFNWNGKYPKKKQWILDNVETSFDWVLHLDADEEVTKEFCHEIEDFLKGSSQDFVACRVRVSYYFMHKELRHGQQVKKTALIKKGYCEYPVLNDLSSTGIREVEGHYQPSVAGAIFNLRNPIIHADAEFIESWMTRHVKYAEWESLVTSNRVLRNEVSNSKDRLPKIFMRVPFRSLIMFIYSYFLKLGFLDGRAGFDYAFSKAWYYWLAGAISREKIYANLNTRGAKEK